MPNFKSIKDALHYAKKESQKSIDKALSNEVFKAVQEVELQHINEDVISVYDPKIYVRRDTRGIEDPANIVASPVKDGVLTVENITQFNPDYETENHGYGLVGLIEYGDGWNGYHYEYPNSGSKKPYNKPRPFIENTRDDLSKNKQHVKALKSGLEKLGINTEK